MYTYEEEKYDEKLMFENKIDLISRQQKDVLERIIRLSEQITEANNNPFNKKPYSLNDYDLLENIDSIKTSVRFLEKDKQGMIEKKKAWLNIWNDIFSITKTVVGYIFIASIIVFIGAKIYEYGIEKGSQSGYNNSDSNTDNNLDEPNRLDELNPIGNDGNIYTERQKKSILRKYENSENKKINILTGPKIVETDTVSKIQREETQDSSQVKK